MLHEQTRTITRIWCAHCQEETFWVCKSCKRGNWPKLQYLYSLVHISSAEARPSLGGFSWQTLYGKWQIYWWGVKQSKAISACTVSPAWIENKDLIVSVCLKQFMKQFFAWSWGKKNTDVLIWDLLSFFKEKNVAWLNGVSRQIWLSFPLPQVGPWWEGSQPGHALHPASPCGPCLLMSNKVWFRTCCN